MRALLGESDGGVIGNRELTQRGMRAVEPQQADALESLQTSWAAGKRGEGKETR